MFFSTKEIAEGEELTFDYGKDYILEWKSQFDNIIKRYLKESS